MCLGRIGTVTKVWDEDGVPLSLVDVEGAAEQACLLGFPDVREGDDVLVHLGFVVEVLDPAHAADARTLRAAATTEGRGLSPPLEELK